MTKQASFRCEYCGTSYVYQQSLDMHLIGCSYRSKALAGQNVVKVYPKQEQLESIVKGLNDSLINIDYLFANENLSFIDRSTLAQLRKDLVKQIDNLRSLYESNT